MPPLCTFLLTKLHVNQQAFDSHQKASGRILVLSIPKPVLKCVWDHCPGSTPSLNHLAC